MVCLSSGGISWYEVSPSAWSLRHNCPGGRELAQIFSNDLHLDSTRPPCNLRALSQESWFCPPNHLSCPQPATLATPFVSWTTYQVLTAIQQPMWRNLLISWRDSEEVSCFNLRSITSLTLWLQIFSKGSFYLVARIMAECLFLYLGWDHLFKDHPCLEVLDLL